MQGLKLKQQIGLILRKDFDAMPLIKQLMDESLNQPLLLLNDEEQMWTQIQRAIEILNQKSLKKLKQIEERATKIAGQVVEEQEEEGQTEEQEQLEQQSDEDGEGDDEQQEVNEEDVNEQEDEHQEMEQEFDEDGGNFRFEKKQKQKDDFDEFEKYMQDYDDGKMGKIDLDDEEIDEDDVDEEENEEENDENNNEGEDSVFDDMREEELEQAQDQEEEQVNNVIEEEDEEIKNLEEQRLKKKDWQFVGEVQARQRPLNSLIEQDLDFDVNRKVLEETTPEQLNKLIEMIKKRVQDELFDDRQKVQINLNSLEKPVDQVDTNKSQFGLAELYERQFKQALGLPTNTSEQKLKQELFEQFRDLCYKLDSLTNLNFEPRGFVKQAEVQVLDNNVVQREEKVPITARGEQQEDVEKIKKAGFLSKEEADHSLNKKGRRMAKQRKRNKEREKRRSGLVKKLESRGETKFMYNQHQQGKKQMSFIKQQKNKESVKFDKTSTFFKNLQESGVNRQGDIKNKKGGDKSSGDIKSKSKQIKKQ
ncbi:unnamed protein product [Paramecium primaurelia]|uniref:Uncharacterized protein n=1 Tax=Paramecium primaurelia TaxID=5886 RepID=A0A8S1Q1C2_PARPR|nr:unnamed protein product [Paramecium primaurelia]